MGAHFEWRPWNDELMRALAAMFITCLAGYTFTAYASVSPLTPRFGKTVPINWARVGSRLQLTPKQLMLVRSLQAQAVLRWNTVRANPRIDADERWTERKKTRDGIMASLKRFLTPKQTYEFELEGGPDWLLGLHPVLETFDIVGVKGDLRNKIRLILYETRKKAEAQVSDGTMDTTEFQRIWQEGISRACQFLTATQRAQFAHLRSVSKNSPGHLVI